MDIKTKYNIGDEVWGMPNGKPVKLTIARIYIKIHKHKLSISYEFDDIDGDDRTYRLQENWISPTKEELLKSL